MSLLNAARRLTTGTAAAFYSRGQRRQKWVHCVQAFSSNANDRSLQAPLFSVKPTEIQVNSSSDADAPRLTRTVSDSSVSAQSLSRDVIAMREMLPYMANHKGRVFVIHVPAKLTDSKQFRRFVKDLALLHTLGIRLVLVIDCEERVLELLADGGITPTFHRDTRIVCAESIKWDQFAAQQASSGEGGGARRTNNIAVPCFCLLFSGDCLLTSRP